jgi:hypothetical protein
MTLHASAPAAWCAPNRSETDAYWPCYEERLRSRNRMIGFAARGTSTRGGSAEQIAELRAQLRQVVLQRGDTCLEVGHVRGRRRGRGRRRRWRGPQRRG